MTVDAASPGKRKAEGLEDDTPSKKMAAISDSPKKVKNVAEFDQRKNFKDSQKSVTPPVADPTRGFYESLLKEKPDSKIAIKWCIENGVFPKEEHNKLLKKYNKLKDSGDFNAAAQLKKAQDFKKSNKEEKKVKKEGKEGKEPKEGKEKKEKKDKGKDKEGKKEDQKENVKKEDVAASDTKKVEEN